MYSQWIIKGELKYGQRTVFGWSYHYRGIVYFFDITAE